MKINRKHLCIIALCIFFVSFICVASIKLRNNREFIPFVKADTITELIQRVTTLGTITNASSGDVVLCLMRSMVYCELALSPWHGNVNPLGLDGVYAVHGHGNVPLVLEDQTGKSIIAKPGEVYGVDKGLIVRIQLANVNVNYSEYIAVFSGYIISVRLTENDCCMYYLDINGPTSQP